MPKSRKVPELNDASGNWIVLGKFVKCFIQRQDILVCLSDFSLIYERLPL